MSNRVVLHVSLCVSIAYVCYTSVLCGTLKHFWVQVKEVVYSGRIQGRGVACVWLDFQLSADKLHFTFQLLYVPLDSRQGRAQGPQGGREGGGVWVVVLGGQWTGGGTLLGGQALEISVVCFSSFQDRRGLVFG